MKKNLIIAGGSVLAYILYAILTGGIVISNSQDYGGQRNVIFTEGLKSDLWVDPNHSGGGIPFLGFYYYTQLPCSLRVQIWDREQKYISITIDTVAVVYPNRKKESFNIGWSRDLQSYTQVNSSSQGLIRTPMMMLSDTTPTVIEYHSDCVVTLSGFLTTTSGESIPFEVIESFEYESSFNVGTFWQMIASI